MAPDLKIHNQLTTSLYFFPWIALERACGAQLLETRGSLNVNLPACCFIKQLSAHSSIHVLTFVWQRGTVKFWPKLSGGETQPVKEHFLALRRSIVPYTPSNWRHWPLNHTSWRYFSQAPGCRREQSQNPSSMSDSLAVYRATDLAAFPLSPWGFQIGRLTCGWLLCDTWYTSGNLFTRALIVPCPLGHRSSLIDFVYSWCKIHTQL